MKIALGAKNKLNFVDGTPSPKMDSPWYTTYKKANCLVMSRLLNSISKDLAESFVYANTTKDLWEEKEARFGECNGPMIYQIQREFSTIT